MSNATKPFLSVAELCERWGGCPAEVVWHAVNHLGLPFLPLGKGAVARHRRGRKTALFRLDQVEAWERTRTVRWADGPTTTPPPQAPATPPAAEPDDDDYLARNPFAKPRRAAAQKGRRR